MPMIWNHMLFSEEVIDYTDRIVHYNLNENYLILGSQGDNLLEFIPFWSTKKLAHKQAPADFVSNINEIKLSELIKSTTYLNRNVNSYLIGYITYCFLETHLKNYIKYFTKLTETNERIIKTNLDTIIMKKYHNLNTMKTPILKEFKFNLLLDPKIKKTIEIVNPYLANNLQKAYLHTLISLRWLFDPYGWKAKAFPSYMPLFGNKSHLINEIDLLNEKHIIWDKFNNDSRSFLEVYNQAKIEAVEFLNDLINFWENDDINNLNNVIKRLQNLNKKAN